MLCWRIGRLSYAVVLTFCVMATPRFAHSAAEETLAELNGKPADERNRVLLDNAKKEGTVTVYTATNNRDTQEIVAGFNKIYPSVQVAFTSLGGPGVLNRTLTEERAGVHTADIVILNGISAVELIDKKIVAKYKSPMIPFLRRGFVDPSGYWPGVYSIGYTIIYNIKRISPKDAPKRYEDLLNPRWKGNMIMDAEAHDLLAGLIELWGEAKATSFLKRLVEEQKLTFSRQSHTFMTQLVAAGEHDLIVDGYAHNGVKLKSDGAPVDVVFVPPTLLRTPSIIAVTAHAPHPHAAALFLNYHLSKEASEIMAQKQGRWAPRQDVRWTAEPEGDLHLLSWLDWGRKNRQLVSLFKKTTGQ
jgi:iron(III) transport system substrate-binding protein